jgi:type IV pilus assembly protein PilY1
MQISNLRQRGPKLRVRTLSCTLAAAFAACGESALATLAIPNAPLTVDSGVPANLLYIHDDSGSMYSSYIGKLSTQHSWGFRTSALNPMYFNPAVTYEIPPNLPIPPAQQNASFTNAWHDGYDFAGRNGVGNYCTAGINSAPRRVNLSTNFRPTFGYDCTWGTSYSSYIWVDSFAERAHYYTYNPGKHGCLSVTSNACYTKHVVTPAQEQNFANWYSYYRTRNLAAKAGIARAFNQLNTDIRVGWGQINNGTYSDNDGKNLHTIVQGVRPFKGAHRQAFFAWLYGLRPTGSTPLKRGLDAAGQYYDRSNTTHPGPWADNPASPGPMAKERGAACRKSFTILMTDGEWNLDNSSGTGTGAASTLAARLNVDGGGAFAGSTWTSPPRPDGTTLSLSTAPFKDSEARTLADVAMYYWSRDLLPSALNKIGTPSKARDPAFWQHMTTYTIAFGYEADVVSKNAAFAALAAGIAPVPGWPKIDANGDGTTEQTGDHSTDDMLHAAVNGHGDFFSADNPQELIDAMQAIISAISSISGGAGNLGTNGAVSGASGSSTRRDYKSTYSTEKWSGDLISTEILSLSSTNHIALGNQNWRAAERLPAPTMRHIFTRKLPVDTIAGAGVPFTWANLNPQQQNNLSGGGTLHGPDVLDYLRGNGSKEGNAAPLFRARHRAGGSSSTLGDSPHSKPLFHAATNTVYLGANDGMLHAFNADTGVERFAYIPSVLFPKLPKLTHQDYPHEYYVDGMAAIANNVASRHYLVGALGRGGKGLYGLDITNAAISFSGSNVKWELNGSVTCGAGAHAATLDDLGLILGEPVIAKLGTGQTVAIVGNGYNSCYGKAALYIVDVTNGDVIQKITVPGGADNGLSTPFALLDSNGVPEVIYAGDLNGNFWRFVAEAGVWKATFGGNTGTPMFVARNASGQIQPITAQPVAARDSDGKLFAFFGTGQFLQNSDKTANAVQSWYGLIDDNGAPAPIPRSALKQRILVASNTNGTLTDGTTVTLRYIDPLGGPLLNERGWYIDLGSAISASDTGERIVSPSIATDIGGTAGMVLIVPSIIPNDDPCDAGGSGHINVVDAWTGDQVALPVFDINGDGLVNGNDKVDGQNSASFGTGSGMPGNIPLISNTDTTFTIGLTNGGVLSTAKLIPSRGGIKGRISWREIIKE